MTSGRERSAGQASRGAPVLVGDAPLLEMQAWVAHRRRVEVRTATKNQLLGRLNRAFPGLGAAIRDVLSSKVGGRSQRTLPTQIGWLGLTSSG